MILWTSPQPTDGGRTKTVFNDTSFPRSVLTIVKVGGVGTTTLSRYEYFDGLGRSVETQSFGENGKSIITTTAYDEMGRVAQSDGPFFPNANGKPPAVHPWLTTTYDDRGRPWKITSSDIDGGTAVTTITYQGLSTTVVDPDARKRITTKNALGRTIKVAEHIGTTPYETTYTYDATGDLLTVKDAEGNLTSIFYDTPGPQDRHDRPGHGLLGIHLRPERQSQDPDRRQGPDHHLRL